MNLLTITLGLVLMSPQAAPATAPADSQPASAEADVVQTWLVDPQVGRQQASKLGKPLLIVHLAADSPASEAMEARTLNDGDVQRVLKRWVAVRRRTEVSPLATRPVSSTEEGKASSAAGSMPLVLLHSPTGELLHRSEGLVLPRPMCQILTRVEAWEASDKALAAGGKEAQLRWERAALRLGLSTRDKAAADIEWLLACDAKELPEGATPARLHLSLSQALGSSDPARAKAACQKARELAAEDAATAASALMAEAVLEARIGDPKQALAMHDQYIRTYPKGADIGQAYVRKASLQAAVLEDNDAARATLRGLVEKYPDDSAVVQARSLLEALTPRRGKDTDF